MSDRPFVPVDCAVLTVSDTRILETDTSGAVIVDRLTTLGHPIAAREIMPDDLDALAERIEGWCRDAAIKVVIITGGTGITRRDVTPEACDRVLATDPEGKHIPGFGELFRWLSYRDIGTSTVQSRAGAWLAHGTLIFALPGSTGAVTLGMDEILTQQLDARHRPCNFIQLLPRVG